MTNQEILSKLSEKGIIFISEDNGTKICEMIRAHANKTGLLAEIVIDEIIKTANRLNQINPAINKLEIIPRKKKNK